MAAVFDAAGVGRVAASGAGLTGAHVLGADATSILVFASESTHTAAAGTCAFSDGTPIPSLGTFLWRVDSQIQVFGLIDPPTGSQQIVFNPSTASGAPTSSFSSVSHKNVASFGPFSSTAAGSGVNLAETVTTDSAPGDLIVQAFAAVSGSALTLGSYNQTSRYNSGSSAYPLVIGEAAAGSSVPFTALASASPGFGWAGASIPLVSSGGGVTVSPASAVIKISGGTPDVIVGGTAQFDADATGYALANTGSAGTTAAWPHPLGKFASSLIVGVTGDFSQPGCPSYASYTRSLTMNGTPLTLLGITDFNPAGTGGYDGWTELWGICGKPVTDLAGTSVELVCNEFFTGAGSTKYPELSCWSGSYSGVVGFGAGQVAHGNSAAPTVPAITSSDSDMVVGVLGSNVFSGGSAGATVRYNVQADGYGNWAMLVEDASGSDSGVSLSGVSGFGYWSAVGVDLIAGTIAPPIVVSPASAVIAITGGTPVIINSVPDFDIGGAVVTIVGGAADTSVISGIELGSAAISLSGSAVGFTPSDFLLHGSLMTVAGALVAFSAVAPSGGFALGAGRLSAFGYPVGFSSSGGSGEDDLMALIGKNKRVYEGSNVTLDDIRGIVLETADYPSDSPVRVHTRVADGLIEIVVEQVSV